MDRGAWWITAHRVAMSQTQLKQLSAHTYRETAKVKSRVRKYIGRRQGPGGGGSGGRGMGSWCLVGIGEHGKVQEVDGGDVCIAM